MLANGTYRQDATYWSVPTTNGYGERTFSAPVLLKVRWEDRNDLFIGPNGESMPSKSVVYVKQTVALGGYLARGDHTGTPDPEGLDVAGIIKGYQEIPALTGPDITRKAIL